jgi:eukaryotic-like serine/threonine-protein kinase
MRGGGVGKVDELSSTWVRMPETTRDSDLGDLCELRGLFYLNLSNTRVTDNGLRLVSDFRELQILGLAGTAVTDEGLRHIESWSNLRFLSLHQCPNTTDAGVARLQKALPKCQIER